MYGGMCAIIVAHAMIHNEGGVKCQPFLICSNHWKGTPKHFKKRKFLLWLFSIQLFDYGKLSKLILYLNAKHQ